MKPRRLRWSGTAPRGEASGVTIVTSLFHDAIELVSLRNLEADERFSVDLQVRFKVMTARH